MMHFHLYFIQVLSLVHGSWSVCFWPLFQASTQSVLLFLLPLLLSHGHLITLRHEQSESMSIPVLRME